MVMELQVIAPGVFLVPAQNRGLFPCSPSVYVDGDRRILFDAGLGPKAMKEFLSSHEVDLVFLSHTHLDNMAGAWALQSFAPLFIPIQAENSCGSMERLKERFFRGHPAAEIWAKVATETMGYRDFAHNRVYKDRDAFDIGSHKLLAIHTPGHCMDHYCFLEQKSGTLLLFDIDLSEWGPWYGDPESDLDQFEASTLLVRSLGVECVVSSHRGVVRQAVDAKLDAFLEIFSRRDQVLLDRLGEPHTAEELATGFPFTPEFIPALRTLFLYWEQNMVTKHLQRLVEGGAVNPLAGGRFVRG
jgi:glyoxylase-like metal-dependent hydrolase (beta-lactamase superfamily II)